MLPFDRKNKIGHVIMVRTTLTPFGLRAGEVRTIQMANWIRSGDRLVQTTSYMGAVKYRPHPTDD